MKGLIDEGIKGLRKGCDRGVRFGIAHAKDAKPRPGRGKGGKGISKFGFRNSKIIFRRVAETLSGLFSMCLGVP